MCIQPLYTTTQMVGEAQVEFIVFECMSLHF